MFVEGEISKSNDEEEHVRLIINNVIPCDKIVELYTQQIHIRLHESETTTEKLESLKNLILENQGDCDVVFCLICDNKDIIFTQNDTLKIKANQETMNKLTFLLGEEAIHVKADLTRPVFQRPKWQTRYHEAQ